MNKLATPFNTEKLNSESNFNEENIRITLKKILDKEDYKFIDKIIRYKTKFFPNDLKIKRSF